MQRPVFGDMNFRSNGMGEYCLSLNVWTPAQSADERLPVLVYFYGGGNMAGDGSEPVGKRLGFLVQEMHREVRERLARGARLGRSMPIRFAQRGAGKMHSLDAAGNLVTRDAHHVEAWFRMVTDSRGRVRYVMETMYPYIP